MSGTPTNRATIYVLYNANASLFGKVKYVYEKLTCAKDDSPCAACDLTHGGLKLHESDEWKATKKQIPANVQQLHLDELTPELREFVGSHGVSTPAVLGQSSDKGALKSLLLSEDLAKCSRNHDSFLSMLFARAEENGVDLPSPAYNESASSRL